MSHRKKKIKRHRPGQIKFTQNEEEKLNNRKQALRQSKSRNIRQLKKIAKSLQKQVLEPVEALFVIKESSRNVFKYFGFGKSLRNLKLGNHFLMRNQDCQRFLKPWMININRKKFNS